MRIGLNLLYLIPGVVGGTETYASGLLAGLTQVSPGDDFIVFVGQEGRVWPLPSAPNIVRIVCPVSVSSRARRYVYEQFKLPRLLKEYGIDLVHSLGYVSPLAAPCSTVVTIPDLNYKTFGSHMPGYRRLGLSFFVRQSALRCAHIITISEFSKREICRTFCVPSSHITVAHLAPKPHTPIGGSSEDTPTLQSRLGIRSPYCLAFGNRGVNKNIPRLLQAFIQARATCGLEHQLVVAGHLTAQDLRGHAQALPPDALCLPGYLDDGTLRTILAHAQFLIVPSFYEGFGLPILEAMEAGIPVVCSRVAALPEVAGDAAEYFDPFSEDDMTLQLARVAQDPQLRKDMVRRGHRNAARFSWGRTALLTLAVYREVVNGGS